MSVVLCNILGTRTEEVAKVVNATTIELSLTDVSTIKNGSILSLGGETAYTLSVDTNNSTVTYFIPSTSTFNPSVGDTITIQTHFRYATEDIVINDGTDDLFYEGRLSVSSINESFGSFIEKTQIISNARINLVNTDGALGSIFHSYELDKHAVVELLFGQGNSYSNYNVFFSGITTQSSNFSYNDTTFSFSAKDNRATLLETTIPNESFDASQFPDFATFNVGMPIVNVVVASIPTGWGKDTVVKNAAGALATISYISGSTLYLYNYSGTFSSAGGANDIFSDQGGSTTISSITAPLGNNLVLKGDTGHFLSNIEDTTPVNTVYRGASVYTVMTSYDSHHWWGGFDQSIPVHTPFQVSKTINKSGYLDTFYINVVSSLSIKSVSLRLSSPSFNVYVDNFNVALATGAKIIDLRNLNLKVLAGQTVTATITAVTTTDNAPTKQQTVFRYQINNVNLDVVGHYNSSGTYTNDIPVDFGTANITNPGKLFFNRNNSNFVKVFVWVSADNGTTYNPITNGGADANSGIDVPKDIGGTPITNIRVSVDFNNDPNFRLPSELYSLEIQYPTDIIIGSTLSSKGKNKPIPIVYGDFSNTYLPAIRLSTISDNTLGSRYTYSNPTTDSLDYTYNSGGASTDFAIGDTIEYTMASGSEKVYAKVTQIIETSGGVGTVYFENFGIVPSTTQSIIISRETNTYKICNHPILSIDSIRYLPKNAKELVVLPSLTNVNENLANGEFSITGINAKDDVFIACRGKPDSVLITGTGDVGSTTTVLNDATATFLTDKVSTSSIVTNTTTGERVNIISVTETSITTNALTIGTWDGANYSITNLLESPIEIIADLASTFSLPIAIVVKGNIEGELATLRFRRFINESTTFGGLLETIENDSNIHSYIDSGNTLTLIRFTATLSHDREYFDFNISPNSFEEQYDPNNITVSGTKFLYDFNPEVGTYDKLVALGTGTEQNIIEFPWLHQTTDAELIANQIFKIIRKTPEIIHVTIAASDALSIVLGDVIKIHYRDEEHILFVYNIIKNVFTSEVEVYGWNLAHGYELDFPIPALAEFPKTLMEEAGWTTPQYEPYTINDPFMYNSNKTVEYTLAMPTVITPSTTIAVPDIAQNSALGEALKFSGSTTNDGIVFASKELPTWKDFAIDINLYWKKGATGHDPNIVIGFTTKSNLDNNNITGNITTDAAYFTTVLTIIGATTTYSTANNTITLTKGSTNNVLLVYFIPTISGVANSELFVDQLYISFPTDRNVDMDRYNYWNPAWPYKLKKYMLDRHIPDIPASGYFTTLTLQRENILRFKK